MTENEQKQKTEYERIKSAAVDEAFRRLMRGEMYEGYLYYRPSQGPAWGALVITDKPPAGFLLAAGQSLGQAVLAMTREQLAAHVTEIAKALPLYPSEGK